MLKLTLLILLIGIFVLANGQTKFNIYNNIASYPCTTLSSKDKITGCTGSRDGDSAPLWPIETQDQYDEFIKSSDSTKKIIVIASTLFTKDNTIQLISSKKVAGILVLEGDPPASGFSPVSPFPNKEFGLHSEADYTWNPWGDNFAFERILIPIFQMANVNDDDARTGSSSILTKARENRVKGGKYPQWGAQLNAFMHASGNSQVCLRRGQCQPLGGKSIWAVLDPIDSSKDIVMAIARLDANAFFRDLASGADAHISGVVAVMLAAQALASVDRSLFKKQLLFSFFGGEAFGYLGSKRWVHDINQCTKNPSDCNPNSEEPYEQYQKLNVNKIWGAIEVDQIGFLFNNHDSKYLYVHQERSQSNVSVIYQTLKNTPSNFSVLLADNAATPGLPPSSLMNLLQVKSDILGVVLAEYNTQYLNRYFYSEYDTINRIASVGICQVASLLAQSLYRIALENNDTSIPAALSVDCSLAAQLEYCLAQNMDCDLAARYLKNYAYSSTPTQYTSVFIPNSLMSITAKFVHDYVYNVTSYKVDGDCDSASDCDSKTSQCIDNKCVSSRTYYHDALSLGFKLDSENNVWKVVDDTQSMWTESNWEFTNALVFKMDSPVTDVVVFILGIFNILANLGIVYYLKGYFTKRFKSP